MTDAPTNHRKQITPAYLERAAISYLERHASSGANLRRILARKAQRRSGGPPEEEILMLIDQVVEKAVRSGLVDDRIYAETKTASLLRRGASARLVGARLAAKGLDRDIVGAVLSEAAPDEFAQARRYAERRRLGPYRSVPDPARRERDLAALARAGFSYRAASAALDGEDPR